MRITPEAVAAWQAADYQALHCALGLAPWEASPLPQEITAGGVSEDNPPDASNTLHDRSYDRAIKLQRLLLAAAGWPDCREVYEKNLREVEKRSLLLERIAARLRLIGRFGDHDVETRVRLAGHNLGIPKLARNG